MRVLMVDDHRLFGEAMRTLLEANGDHVVTITTNGQEAVQAVVRNEADVVLVDLVLPGEDGMEIGKRILEASPQARVVIFTALDDPGRAKDAIAAGFHGFITKNVAAPKLLAYLNAVLRSETRVAAAPVWSSTSSDPASEEWRAKFAASQLTRREREVLRLLMVGSDGGSIAAALSISLNTVRTHIQNILSKLQVHSRLEAVAFAVRHRLVTPRSDEGRRPAVSIGGVARQDLTQTA